MYDATDPRAALMPTASRPSSGFADAECARFYEAAPQQAEAGGRTWLVRGQNCVVAYTAFEDGCSLRRPAQPDEYALLLPDSGTAAEVSTPRERVRVPGRSIAFIPAGASEVTLSGSGAAVRLFTARAGDLAERCANARRAPDPNVPPFEAWPDPSAGPRVHVYGLDVADEPGRFGRIWRGSTLMVNVLPEQVGPRDVTKLSPHHHDDFEQISLALSGAYVHHLRWPWTTDLTQWRDDRHESCGSPSALVIPPPAIHTSRAVHEGVNLLVDVFCPPRRDFSLQPGWVLNGADYPMPGERR